MCKTVKAPTSYTQQVALIKKKGIDVSDPSACESLLAKINYYRFSGYFRVNHFFYVIPKPLIPRRSTLTVA